MRCRGAAWVIAAALAVAACGCGRAADVAERRVRLPSSLPADLPLPGGALLRSSQELGDRGINLVFESGEPVAVELERLRAGFAAAGWTVLSEASHAGAVFVTCRKEGRTAALGISRTGEVTVIGLAYQERAAEGEAG